MSKNKKGTDYSKVMPTLVKQVEKVLEEADKHNYSTLGVFNAYNAAYGLNDKPQTCSSCLRARVKLLREWMKGYKAQLKDQTPPNHEYVQAYELQDGKKLYTQNDLLDPPLCFENGEVIADGNYVLKDGVRIIVSSGAIVTMLEKVEPQYTDPAAPGYVQQKEGTVRYLMTEGMPFDFLPNEGTSVKGNVMLADGSSIKPGTYITANNLKIVVQPGGKANIRKIEEDPNKDNNKTE